MTDKLRDALHQYELIGPAKMDRSDLNIIRDAARSVFALEVQLAKAEAERDEAREETVRAKIYRTGVLNLGTVKARDDAESRASALEELLAECGMVLDEASDALSRSICYIDGNPPHKHLPNLDWLAAVDRLTRALLAKLKARTGDVK